MGSTAWLTRRWLRRRRLAVLPVALVVCLGGAATMLAIAAADRTATAYTDYLERSDVGDVVINPAVATQEIDAVIRNLPGVERVTTSALLTVSFEEGQPMLQPGPEVTDVIDDRSAFVLGSHDGRYFDMDRPAVSAGRMPTGPSEAVVTPRTAAALDIEIGDVVPMSFWAFGLPDGLQGEALERYRSEIVSPIGVEHVTITGIVTLADEVLPDELYPRQRAIVSPDLAERYDCIPSEPPAGVTLAEAIEILLPDDCAFAQHYFSLSLADGAAGVKPALEEFVRVSAEMNEELLDISDLGQVPGDPPQYFLIPTETQGDVDAAESAIRPTVGALVVLGLLAAAVTIAIAGLAVWRELQRGRDDQVRWHQLGVGRGSRIVVVTAPLVLAAVAGVVVAVPIGWLLDVGPVGLVAAMEPGASRRLDGLAVLAVVAIGLAVAVLSVGLATLSARRSDVGAADAEARRRRPLPLPLGPPVVTEGVRAAFRPRSSLPVVAGTAIAIAGFVAALTFGTSLSTLVSTPRAYGWPWDVAAMVGAGYGDLDVERATQLLDADPDVRDWTHLAFISQVSLNGEPTTAVIAPGAGADPGLTLLSGAMPGAADEVAIGAATAKDRDVGVGDTVEIGGVVSPRPATVTGIVVFPTVGPFGSDRVSIGRGLLLPDALFDAEDLVDLRVVVSRLSAFVGVELEDGVAKDAAVARLRGELGALDRYGVPGVTYPEAVRPAEIIDAADTRSLPVTVGLVLAVTAVFGLAVASWASARARRRDLAVLRAFGLSGGQVRRTVWVQSVATMVGALVIGVPLGVVAGRLLWRAFADQLGVLADPASPWFAVVLGVVGGLLAAFLAALVPGELAARTSPASGLRAE